MSVTIDLPLRLGRGLNDRKHWAPRSKQAKAERQCAHLLVKHRYDKPPLPVVVTLVRLSAGTLDDDNLQGAFKAVRDGVADAYGIPDNDPRLRFQYAQERAKRGTAGVRVVIASA